MNMKNCLKAVTPVFFLLAAALCAIILFPTPAKASAYGDYRFELENYEVTYDIAANCEIKVTEVMKINYLGIDSTGFYRDIPVNGGARVKNVNVEGVELLHGNTVPFEVTIQDGDFVTVDIGDRTAKYNRSETYRLTYTYCISNRTVKNGTLPLNPVGTGWDCVIKHAEVKLILPDGYESAVRYVGPKGYAASDMNFTTDMENGRLVLTTSQDNLKAYNGITFDLTFKKGAIKPYSDFTPYLFVIAAAGLIILIVLVKVLFFCKNRLTPVVNFEPPEGLDPLMMGKLIDNRVNSEDVTSLIYYWADKGYLKINFDNKYDPVLIKIKNLPPTAADYERIVFESLFKNGDSVKTSLLGNSFYVTYERATAMVNEKAKGLYSSVSIGVSILFAVIGGLLTGLAPFILALTEISGTFCYAYGFVTLIPALVLYGFAESIAYNRFKNRGKKNIIYLSLLPVIIILCSLIYALLIPSSVIPFLPKFLLCAVSLAAVCISAVIISRTPEYNKKLNEIIGFRNFILAAEKDRLEKMLESDPQYYYRILPYAQVMNVSDIWEEKFKSLTVAPPVWAVGSSLDIFDFMLINSVIRSSASGIARGMITRPSSSGSNGFHGSFGGFSGGGFGGGGGRGR